MANSRISDFSKNVIRTNAENSVEVGLFVTSLIHSFIVLFIQIQVIADQLFYSYKFYLYQYEHIYICILFALNQKSPTMLYEDVKVVCKVIYSLC